MQAAGWAESSPQLMTIGMWKVRVHNMFGGVEISQ